MRHLQIFMMPKSCKFFIVILICNCAANYSASVNPAFEYSNYLNVGRLILNQRRRIFFNERGFHKKNQHKIQNDLSKIEIAGTIGIQIVTVQLISKK